MTAGSLLLVVFAAQRIGSFFTRIHLPMMTGYIMTGVLAGPFIFGFISKDGIDALGWTIQTCLAYIAFTAGGELSLNEIRQRLRSILWVTAGLVFCTFLFGSIAVYLISDMLPFMHGLPPAARLAVAILAGAILVARSPSSAVAIIKELRAKGTFTQTMLGVTVIMDAVVIALFALNSSVADAILTGVRLNWGFLLLLAVDFGAAIALGYIVSGILRLLFRLRLHRALRFFFLLLTGYCVCAVSGLIRAYSNLYLPAEILIEPLLVCMLSGFLVRNASPYKNAFHKTLHALSPPVFMIFFTLAGAALEMNVLAAVWQAAIILFFVRLGTIFVGSFLGGLLGGDSLHHSRISWMAFITQAGIGLGLAQEVAVAFPDWGSEFAAMMMAVIVLNQLVGPVLFRRVLLWVKEARPLAKKSDPNQIPLAVIFGADAQALTLARQLTAHDWQVRMVVRQGTYRRNDNPAHLKSFPYDGLARNDLERYGLGDAGAAVMTMDDAENYAICKAVKAHFPDVHRIVALTDISRAPLFKSLGADIVTPSTAMVSLLDHFVRSPSVVSLLLGHQKDQDIIELEMRNPSFHGSMVKDLNLPPDALFLGIRRGANMRMAKGKTRLSLRDQVTVAGPLEGLETVKRLFNP